MTNTPYLLGALLFWPIAVIICVLLIQMNQETNNSFIQQHQNPEEELTCEKDTYDDLIVDLRNTLAHYPQMENGTILIQDIHFGGFRQFDIQPTIKGRIIKDVIPCGFDKIKIFVQSTINGTMMLNTEGIILQPEDIKFRWDDEWGEYRPYYHVEIPVVKFSPPKMRVFAYETETYDGDFLYSDDYNQSTWFVDVDKNPNFHMSQEQKNTFQFNPENIRVDFDVADMDSMFGNECGFVIVLSSNPERISDGEQDLEFIRDDKFGFDKRNTYGGIYYFQSKKPLDDIFSNNKIYFAVEDWDVIYGEIIPLALSKSIKNPNEIIECTPFRSDYENSPDFEKLLLSDIRYEFIINLTRK